MNDLPPMPPEMLNYPNLVDRHIENGNELLAEISGFVIPRKFSSLPLFVSFFLASSIFLFLFFFFFFFFCFSAADI